MHRHGCAYRHANDEVEGFTGWGFYPHRAAEDCERQVRIRCRALGAEFEPARMIYAERDLTPDEMEQVRTDWASGRRHKPDGTPYAGQTGS